MPHIQPTHLVGTQEKARRRKTLRDLHLLDLGIVYGPIGVREKTGAIFAGWGLLRDTDGIKCPACGGYADLVISTEAECAEYTCGRDRPGHECCTASFVCSACGARSVGKRAAPEME